MLFQTAEIERRIEQETKAEKHIQKLLLLGMHTPINSHFIVDVHALNHISILSFLSLRICICDQNGKAVFCIV